MHGKSPDGLGRLWVLEALEVDGRAGVPQAWRFATWLLCRVVPICERLGYLYVHIPCDGIALRMSLRRRPGVTVRHQDLVL